MQGNIGAMWCFSVPLGFLAAFWLKLPVMVVYCIVNLDEIVKLPAVYHHYKKVHLGSKYYPRCRRLILTSSAVPAAGSFHRMQYPKSL